MSLWTVLFYYMVGAVARCLDVASIMLMMSKCGVDSVRLWPVVACNPGFQRVGVVVCRAFVVGGVALVLNSM